MAPSSGWLRPDPTVEFGLRMNEVVLEKVRLGCSIPTDAQIWSDMQVGIHQQMDMLADQVIFQFTSTVFKEKLPPQSVTKDVEFREKFEYDVYMPKNTWQFFKMRTQSRRGWSWLFTYARPVKYVTERRVRWFDLKKTVTVDLQHSVIYPKAKAIASPSMGGVAIRWVEPEWQK